MDDQVVLKTLVLVMEAVNKEKVLQWMEVLKENAMEVVNSEKVLQCMEGLKGMVVKMKKGIDGENHRLALLRNALVAYYVLMAMLFYLLPGAVADVAIVLILLSVFAAKMYGDDIRLASLRNGLVAYFVLKPMMFCILPGNSAVAVAVLLILLSVFAAMMFYSCKVPGAVAVAVAIVFILRSVLAAMISVLSGIVAVLLLFDDQKPEKSSVAEIDDKVSVAEVDYFIKSDQEEDSWEVLEREVWEKDEQMLMANGSLQTCIVN